MKKIHYILFTLAFATKSFTDGMFVSRGINTPIDDMKYVLMALAVLILWFDKKFIEKNNPNIKYKRFFVKELRNINFIVLTLIFVSMIQILISGKYTLETVKEIVYLWIPGIYAYQLLNELSIDDMDKYFTTLLLCFSVGYFMEIYDKLTLNNFLHISYAKSYSPFESAYMSGSFTALFLYFLYRKNFMQSTISFIFILMTFKRLSIIFAIFMLAIFLIFNRQRNVSRKTINILKIFFILAPILIYFYLRPKYIYLIDTKFNVDLDKILMGRANIFNTVIDKGFESYGYGSTTDLVLSIFPQDGHLHLDLVKIFMETTILGLVVFVNNLWNIAGRNRYAVLIMLYQFLNILTSHSLRGSFSWNIIYLIVGMISIENYRKEHKYDIR